LLAAMLACALLVGVSVRTLPAGGRRRWLGVAGAVLVFGTPLNIASCLFAQQRNGGGPDVVIEGRYYVSSRGRRTEVPEGVWYALRAHERATWAVTPVGLLAGLWLYGGYLRSARARNPATAEPGSALSRGGS
jgi:hypothetical protein